MMLHPSRLRYCQMGHCWHTGPLFLFCCSLFQPQGHKYLAYFIPYGAIMAGARRITCMVSVLPPLVTLFVRMFCLMARPNANGIKTGVVQEALIFKSDDALLNFSGTLSLYGKRHCPSAAMDAPSSWPASSSITKEVGELNSGLGRQRQTILKANKIAVIYHYFWLFELMFEVLYGKLH
jgi:hypothetical protein